MPECEEMFRKSEHSELEKEAGMKQESDFWSLKMRSRWVARMQGNTRDKTDILSQKRRQGQTGIRLLEPSDEVPRGGQNARKCSRKVSILSQKRRQGQTLIKLL